MGHVRRLLAVALAVALVSAGAALAARGDPRERFTAVDQTRARAMLLRKADLGTAFTAVPPSQRETGFSCRALDESDLTITGKASSPQFVQGVAFVASTAYVYASVGDANASWSRGTSPAGQRCLRDGLRRELQRTGAQLRSFAKLQFPRVGRRSVSYRAVAERQGVPIYLDLVALQHGRAQAGFFVGSGLVVPPRDVKLRLGRVVATRMARAMGGG